MSHPNMSHPNRPMPLGYISGYSVSSGLGTGNAATVDALRQKRIGLRRAGLRGGGETWIGSVDAVDDRTLRGKWHPYDCRLNRVITATLEQDGLLDRVGRLRTRYGAARIGCFVATIGSGVKHLEERYQSHDPAQGDLGPDLRITRTAHLFSVTEYCQQLLGLRGPAATISTACSSSAKVFGTAVRHLRAGLCDAAIVGGADCANEGDIYGFRALGVLSQAPCRPWDRDRDGISIGEGAGFVLLEREPAGEGLALLGIGESVDAYHMTAPHPEGGGAEAAIRRALASAGLSPADIDYVNLHGSGTPSNDAAEDRAVARVFGSDVPCSSTKSWHGHTLGAAGIVEAVLSILAMTQGFVPATLNTKERDPALKCAIALDNEARQIRRALNNSFGFGGNNCAMIVGETQ